MSILSVFALALSLAAPQAGGPAPELDPGVIETLPMTAAFRMEKARISGKPTVFVFYQTSSSADRALVEEVRANVIALKGKVGLRLAPLHSLDAPAAREYEIRETPTLMALDRFGNLLKRTSKFEEIIPAVGKALNMARIKWVNEDDPEAATVYKGMGGGRSRVAGIIKTMSLRPELMEAMMGVASRAHFSNGFLDRRTKEMIATYVSSLNHCRFCMSSHAAMLKSAGGEAQAVEGLASGDPAKAGLTPKLNALMDYVRVLTRTPGEVNDDLVQRMRATGWTDEQIFEASFDTALFAFFNRMAEAYGLDYAPGGYRPKAEAR